MQASENNEIRFLDPDPPNLSQQEIIKARSSFYPIKCLLDSTQHT